MSIGMPATLALGRFGWVLQSIFHETPYHVGSSLAAPKGRVWRDVDVRIMLNDAAYRESYGDPENPHLNERWCVVCEALSLLGREMTGLPIDFQIQSVDLANHEEAGNGRSALGIAKQLRDLSNLPLPPAPKEER